MKFLIRYNVEYTLEVEADSEEKALKKAENAPADDWTKAASSFEIDEDYRG